MQYLGDFAEDATVYIPFNTFSSNDPQASVTITNLADADIKVHKDGGLTEIATDGATIAIDFDSITGNHLITIDTSASTDYSIGSDYIVRIEGTTVDAGTVNAFIGSFSIENRFDNGTAKATALATAQADLDIITDVDGVILGAAGVDLVWDEDISGHQTLNSTGRSQTLSSTIVSETTVTGTPTTTEIILAAGSAVDDFYNDMIAIPTSGALAGQARTITDYTGSTRTITVDEAWTSAMSSGDGIFIKATHVHPVTQIRSEMDNNSTKLAAIVADTNELQTDDIPALITALNDVSVSDILTTQMTESYAADGTAPTLAQAIQLIQQSIGDFGIVGTTLTAYKLDGTTAAATYTLDSSTAPTSRTRST